MSFSMTRTVAETFSLTHAKYLASKVTADMKRCQQNYGKPTDQQINDYGTELALLLRDDYVEAYEFGFLKDGSRLLCWKYAVTASTLTPTDDRPGRILSGVTMQSALFFNTLTYSSKWQAMSAADQARVGSTLPLSRNVVPDYPDGAGYWEQDRIYSAGGVSLPRRTFRPYAA